MTGGSNNNNVPRRYASDESEIREHFHGTKYLDISVAASKICDKCKEVDFQSSAGNQYFGTPNQFFDHDICFTRGEKVLKFVSQCQ